MTLIDIKCLLCLPLYLRILNSLKRFQWLVLVQTDCLLEHDKWWCNKYLSGKRKHIEKWPDLYFFIFICKNEKGGSSRGTRPGYDFGSILWQSILVVELGQRLRFQYSIHSPGYTFEIYPSSFFYFIILFKFFIFIFFFFIDSLSNRCRIYDPITDIYTWRLCVDSLPTWYHRSILLLRRLRNIF